jgi:hypothetical protein
VELCFGNWPASTRAVSRWKRNDSPFEVKQAYADRGPFATDKKSPACVLVAIRRFHSLSSGRFRGQ